MNNKRKKKIAVEKWEVVGKEEGRVMERVELTKVHSQWGYIEKLL
jgi:hypothetical protein